jgi:hypothetical protein
VFADDSCLDGSIGFGVRRTAKERSIVLTTTDARFTEPFGDDEVCVLFR